MASVITQNELLEALAAAVPSGGPADARTVGEMSAETGLQEFKIRQALKILLTQQRLTAHRVHRDSIDGRKMSVPAYTIAPVRKRK